MLVTGDSGPITRVKRNVDGCPGSDVELVQTFVPTKTLVDQAAEEDNGETAQVLHRCQCSGALGTARTHFP